MTFQDLMAIGLLITEVVNQSTLGSSEEIAFMNLLIANRRKKYLAFIKMEKV